MTPVSHEDRDDLPSLHHDPPVPSVTGTLTKVQYHLLLVNEYFPEYMLISPHMPLKKKDHVFLSLHLEIRNCHIVGTQYLFPVK